MKKYFWADRSYEDPQDCQTVIEYLCEAIITVRHTQGAEFGEIANSICDSVYPNGFDPAWIGEVVE